MPSSSENSSISTKDLPESNSPETVNNPITKASDRRVFDEWRTAFSIITGLGLTEEQRAKAYAENQRVKCEKRINQLAMQSPAVTFMLERIEKETGVKVVPSEHIVCIPCDRSMGRLGGFSPELGIILLCQDNKLQSKKRMEDTLTHELVHFYDHCKFNVNWMNLRHVACSEIRANSLSGDCKWIRELNRLSFGFAKQHQECVRRRAIMSVQGNPACPDADTAEKAVNEVWESCFSDTRPFDEIY